MDKKHVTLYRVIEKTTGNSSSISDWTNDREKVKSKFESWIPTWPYSIVYFQVLEAEVSDYIAENELWEHLMLTDEDYLRIKDIDTIEVVDNRKKTA